jgi:hypothetical protein
MIYFQRIREELQELDAFDSREIQGCSELEIKKLESLHPAKLDFPLSVREFLSWGGKQIVDMHPTTGFYVKTIEEMLRNMTTKFLDSDNFHQVFIPNRARDFPGDGLIFLEHLDYSFEFVRLTEGDDPPVYYFDDDPERSDFEVIYPSFSEAIYNFFLDFKDMHERRIEKFPELRQPLNYFKRKVLDMLDLIDKNIKNEAQGNWARLWKCYRRTSRDIYKLYDLDTNTENDINYCLDVYDMYDESEMGKTWGEAVILAEEIKKYFQNEIRRVIEIKRTSC